MRTPYVADSLSRPRLVLATFTNDITWTEAAGWVYGGTYVGPDAIVEKVFKRLATEWDNFQAKTETLIGDGDQVAALGTYEATYKETGRSIEARFVHWWTLSEGKITRFEQIVDSAITERATSTG